MAGPRPQVRSARKATEVLLPPDDAVAYWDPVKSMAYRMTDTGREYALDVCHGLDSTVKASFKNGWHLRIADTSGMKKSDVRDPMNAIRRRPAAADPVSTCHPLVRFARTLEMASLHHDDGNKLQVKCHPQRGKLIFQIIHGTSAIGQLSLGQEVTPTSFNFIP